MGEQRTMTTYRRKDGDAIDGTYGWVTDLDFFDGYYPGNSVDLVKEVWVLKSSEQMTYPPPCEHVWDEGECVECGSEREVVEARAAVAKGDANDG